MLSVPIDVYIKDELVSKGNNWELGLWEIPDSVYNKETNKYDPTGKMRNIWGLVYEGGRTQMCYGEDYADPKESIEKKKERYKNDPDPDWLRWYFDVGRSLYVKLEDLEKACKLLGIGGYGGN